MSKLPIPGAPARPDEDRLIFLGTITKPQGLKGGVRLWAEFDNPEDFELLKTERFFLKAGKPAPGLRPQPTQYFEITLNEFSEHQRFLVLFFEGVTDPDAAERLRGAEVFVYEDEMWDLPEGQFYTYQLVGLEVFDENTGEIAGAVKEVRPGVQDYLVVSGSGKSFLLPKVPEIVSKIDLEAKRITARIPEGLADL